MSSLVVRSADVTVRNTEAGQRAYNILMDKADRQGWLLLVGVLLGVASLRLNAEELFSKGSYSKNYFDEARWEERISGSAGVAISLFKGFRIEGRYTYIHNLENEMAVNIGGVAATLANLKTKTVIYSVGVDIDLANSRSAFQPFLFFGVGVLENASSFVVVEPILQEISEQKRQRLSGNLGLGLRLQLGKSMALELEGMAYATDVDKPKPIINTNVTAGIRLFI